MYSVERSEKSMGDNISFVAWPWRDAFPGTGQQFEDVVD